MGHLDINNPKKCPIQEFKYIKMIENYDTILLS